MRVTSLKSVSLNATRTQDALAIQHNTTLPGLIQDIIVSYLKE